MTLFSVRRRNVLLCLLVSAVTWGMLAGVAKAAPTNTAPPTITGVAQQGQILTLNQGTWTDAVTPTITITDQWESCTSATACTAISGQIGATYTVSASDVGHTIEVLETASTTTDGSANASSAPTAAVTALPQPVNTVLPTISGTAQEGKVLTLTKGTWNNNPTTVTDQWEDCDIGGAACTPITNQTAATYTVGTSDVGHTIEVLETATNAGGTTTASSAPTLQIVAPPTELSAPSISGTPQQGSVLTEHHGTWTGNPTSFSYQWMRCVSSGCTAIAGATNPTYVPTGSDVGASMLVEETAVNAGGSSPPAGSALTSVVTTPLSVVPAPVNTAAPTVAGVPRQGQTLLEAHGTWSNNPTSYRYQWVDCGGFGCTPIPGATGQSYTLTASDVGQSIFVVETASNAGGSGAPANSARTAAVSATSATSLVVSPSGSLTNQIVTLVATVSSSSPNAIPGGWLTFYDGSSAIGGCANEGFQSAGQSATLICRGSFGAGAAGLTAVYTPGPGSLVGASASPLTMLDVGRDSTSVSLAVTKQVARGSRATYTASVVLPVSNSGPLEPTGSIEFLDRGRAIRGCLSRPLKGLSATCVISYKSRGRHSISARYSGDSNFVSSTSPSRSVQVGKGSPGPIVVGFINSTLQWQFYYHPAYTRVTLLRADGLTPGMSVTLACQGARCPFGLVSIPIRSPSSINLMPKFHKRHLRVGERITVRMTRPHWIGKFYSFTVRAGRGPLIVLSCLGVGRTRPGVGC